MSRYGITESDVEEAALEWLEAVGYTILHGPNIAPNQPTAERDTYSDVILSHRLYQALQRLNPQLPAAAIEDAHRHLLRPHGPNLYHTNHTYHQHFINGVSVSYQNDDGRTIHTQATLFDYHHPFNNDWLAVNQFSIRKEGTIPHPNRPLEDTYRPDIILFVNGLPLIIIELKNAANEKATVADAYKQLQTYKAGIPALFATSEALVASDGTDARMGTLTAGPEWFKPWRTIDGHTLAKGRSPLETLIRGALAPHRFLDLMRYFTLFETSDDQIVKKMAGYHQYHAANKAVERTINAIKSDGKVGVVWHTQGSGKSLSMLFYAGKIIQHPQMANPTLVLLTDRNDLDDQLFTTFASGHELLRQTPVQAQSRQDMRQKLSVASGGVVFTTIQKFLPESGVTQHPQLSDRANIIFIVDEAHRTQYGLSVEYVHSQDGLRQRYGLAQHMRDALPNAAFIGFTGTPVSQTDRNTRHVFGEYIDIYDIQRAVEDNATVPIYYEARHAAIKLDESYAPHIDPDFEEVTEGEEQEAKEHLKTKWSKLETVVGDPDRLAILAQDIVTHYETRDKSLPGKAMIVCMSRAICVKMYDALINLRPHWHSNNDDEGTLKVVMTGSAADERTWQPHIRSKRRRKALAQRFRDPETPFKLVIVRDMWLTGFDAPSLHTMYLDKPMKGHNLMQAIARVNRVFPEKQGGTIVAYLPLQTHLQEALKDYTDGDRDQVGNLQEAAAAIMAEKHTIVKDMLHGFDYTPFFNGSPATRLTILANAVEHVLEGRDNGRNRFIQATTELGRAFALANPHPQAIAIREAVGFFQAIKATLVKQITTPPPRNGQSREDVETAVQNIVDRAVAPDGVIDLFALTDIQGQMDISILSEEFLVEVQALEKKNLAVELLRRLINNEIQTRRRGNLVQARSFAAMLRDTLERYNREQVTAVEILDELLTLVREIQAARRRGEDLGLTDDELAFYDALEVNDSAVKILGNDTLKEIAQTLVTQVRQNISIDWALKEDARAHMRVIVKRILRSYGYPPDKQKKATETVVAQAELLSKQWSEW